MKHYTFTLGSLLILVGSRSAHGAFGDEIVRRVLPAPCTTGAVGLGFDGKTLFYSIRVDPDGSRIRKLDAATGADLGAIEPHQGPLPVPSCCSGNEFDPNRGLLWANAGGWNYAVDVQTGEVKNAINRASGGGAPGIGYDPWRDVVYDSPHDYQVWGFCPAYAGGQLCETNASPVKVCGLTFDGYDLWNYTMERLAVPAPQGFGVIFASDTLGQPDLTRVIDVPGVDYFDLAFDCVTFPVPVVWISSNGPCELIAYEITMRGPCLDMASEHIVRAALPAPLDPLARSTVLPLVNAKAQAFWASPQPFLFSDDRWGILTDLSQPLAFYRLLGPGDVDRGNVLRAVKDTPRNAVVLSKP